MTDRALYRRRRSALLRSAVWPALAMALAACGTGPAAEGHLSTDSVAHSRRASPGRVLAEPPSPPPSHSASPTSSTPVAPAGPEAPRESRWRVLAVEYARSRAVPRARLVRGERSSGRVDMSWYFFVARSDERVVLVDCGTNVLSRPGAAQRSRWSIAAAVPIADALRRVDLAPEDVTDIILTHRHWDHVGALGLFRGARVHVHPDEWRTLPSALRQPVEASRRLRPTRGAAPAGDQLFPGLRVREAGQHTAHQLMVSIDCDAGPITIAGDAAYLYANIEDALPVTVATDRHRNAADVAVAVSEVGSGRVIPGHDPELFRRFPSPDPGVAEICP